MRKTVLLLSFYGLLFTSSVQSQDWQIDQGLMHFTYQNTPGPPPAGPLISRWEMGVGNSFSNPTFFSIDIYKFVLDYIIKQPALVINDTSLYVGIGTNYPKGRLHINNLNNFGSQRAALQIGTHSGSSQGYLTINKPNADNSYQIASFRDNGVTSVNIGEQEATYQLRVFGDINANNLMMVSDARYKSNVAKITHALSDLRKIKPRSYDFSQEAQRSRNLPSEPQFGLLAQEVMQVYPHLVRESIETDTDGTTTSHYSVNYIGLIPVLIAANQELDGQYRQLQEENKALLKRIEHLEQHLPQGK